MEADDPISKLYEASMEGSVTSLESLIKNDGLILDKISLSPFSETPLHVSALLGRTRFSEALVDLCPGLARLLDYHGRSPLHLAAANGHADTIRALLSSRHRGDNDDMCLVRDREGRVALHYAAMRGHVATSKALVAAEPRSVWERLLPGGETVAHLCVRYNQLEALRMLVEMLSSSSLDSAARLLNSNDNADGNTVLHLAVLLKQIETVKYLVSVPGVKQDTQNHKGFKPAELIDQLQTDFTTLKLKLIITSTNRGDDNRVQSTEQARRCQLAVRLRDRTLQWLESEQMRGSITVVATLIAQTTFQVAINPPSGVREQTTTKDAVSRVAYLRYDSRSEYLMLIKFNTVSFLASLGAVLLLAGGFPHKSRFCAWLMAVAILVALTFMVGTYLMAIQMAAPDDDFFTMITVVDVSFEFWVAILGFVSAIHLVFLLVWLLHKFPLTRRLGLCFNSPLEMGRS